MEQLIEQLKQELITELNLEELSPADIDPDAPLFGDGAGLGLDSIDALEITLILDRNYGVKIINPSDAMAKQIFSSVRSLAQYICEQRGNPV
jgi:acyl carrier protein